MALDDWYTYGELIFTVLPCEYTHFLIPCPRGRWQDLVTLHHHTL